MAQNNATLQDPTQLQGSFIRQNGQVYQQGAAPAAADRGSMTPSPITPAGVQATGGTPDQSKMAGTPAQKNPIIQQNVAAPPVQKVGPQAGTQLQQQAQQSQSQEQQLNGLTGFNARVQSLVEGKFNALQNTSVVPQQVTSAVQGAFSANQQIPTGGTNPDGSAEMTNVTDLLNQYAKNPSDQGPLALLSKGLSTPGTAITPTQIATLYNTGAVAIGTSAAQHMSDNVIMSDFSPDDLKSVGFAGGLQQLSTTTGIPVDQLQTMSVSDFSANVQHLLQQSYNQVAGLKNQLANVPPGSNAAQQIQQKITDLTGAGVASTETSAHQLANTLNDLDQVNIGGQTYKAQDFLKDDNISQLIVNYIQAPDQSTKDAIFPPDKFAGLTKWIGDNQAALGAAAAHMAQTATDFDTANSNFHNFATQVDPDVLKNAIAEYNKQPGVSPIAIPTNGTATAAQLNQLQQQLSTIPSVAVSIADPASLGITKDQKNQLLSDLNADPTKVNGLNQQQILTAWQAGQAVRTHPELAQLTGISNPGAFISDPKVQAQITNLTATADLLNDPSKIAPADSAKILGDAGVLKLIRNGNLTPDMIQAGASLKEPTGDPLLGAPEVQTMIRAGLITPANAAEMLPKAAGFLTDYRNTRATETQLSEAKNTDQVLQLLFKDPNVSMAQIQSNEQALTDRIAMGDQSAIPQLNDMQQLDNPGKVQAVVDAYQHNNMADWLSGKAQAPAIGAWANTTQQEFTKAPLPDPNSIFANVQSLLKENGLTGAGMLPDKIAEDIATAPGNTNLSQTWRNAHLPPNFRTPAAYAAYQQGLLPPVAPPPSLPDAATTEGTGGGPIGEGSTQNVTGNSGGSIAMRGMQGLQQGIQGVAQTVAGIPQGIGTALDQAGTRLPAIGQGMGTAVKNTAGGAFKSVSKLLGR